MPSPFAALESRVNAACRDRLANAEAVIGSITVSGIFGNAYADQLGMAGNQPALTIVSSDAPSAAVGNTVSINSVSYTVTEIQPDGTGMTLLILRRS